MKYSMLFALLLLLTACGQEYDFYSMYNEPLIEVTTNEVIDNTIYNYITIDNGKEKKHFKKKKRHNNKHN